jgi:hypothetical protein
MQSNKDNAFVTTCPLHWITVFFTFVVRSRRVFTEVNWFGLRKRCTLLNSNGKEIRDIVTSSIEWNFAILYQNIVIWCCPGHIFDDISLWMQYCPKLLNYNSSGNTIAHDVNVPGIRIIKHERQHLLQTHMTNKW